MSFSRIVKMLIAGYLCAGHDYTAISANKKNARMLLENQERSSVRRFRQLGNSLAEQRPGRL